MVQRLALGLLRRHIGRGADYRAFFRHYADRFRGEGFGGGARGSMEFGKPKVQHFN